MRSSRSVPPEAPQPSTVDPRHAWLIAQPFAHRGLHGAAVAENSRSAFAAAIRDGHGIELDVRLSRDGYAVVFHDAELARLTGREGCVADLTVAQLSELTLAEGRDRIEALPQLLGFVARRAPLLIELKTDDDPHVAARLCLSVRYALEGYRGRAAVMSFDPAVPEWFALHAPDVSRGLVIGTATRHPLQSLRTRLHLRRGRPHFLAHDVRALPSRLAAPARRRGLPVLAWTVRSAEDYAVSQGNADQIIFESPR
jgi:glycerophosphoryl diester phosphodiesterase